MAVREGTFWDVMNGQVPPPPAATLLGWTLLAVDPDAGTIRVQFEARKEFLNPAGFVQGGLLAAMLDDTMGPALVATLGKGEFAPTLDLRVSFLRPVQMGRIVGDGRVVHRGGSIAFLAGELRGADGALVATGTATAKLQRISP